MSGAVTEPRASYVEGELGIGELVGGARVYVCMRGGVAVDPVLGSRSTDLLTGLGPRPLQAGDILPIGEEPAVHRMRFVDFGDGKKRLLVAPLQGKGATAKANWMARS